MQKYSFYVKTTSKNRYNSALWLQFVTAVGVQLSSNDCAYIKVNVQNFQFAN